MVEEREAVEVMGVKEVEVGAVEVMGVKEVEVGAVETRCVDGMHITHLGLEAVDKTVRAFCKELKGKMVRLYCDNQAVMRGDDAVALYLTTPGSDEENEETLSGWSLLDLNDIELQAW
ncbi:hypothetical protein CYMTET_4958 [Cymbomonas tetramitiformis]|uniref:Uncharacterized protein n=1 Tax=Cymbomonas tetramitiformis TaxID=36881 RepID=A0AAE0LJE0_9CHLO|nr:hypothetical protein CYMTET_4958 [Cymbomonas tetramitiformis]